MPSTNAANILLRVRDDNRLCLMQEYLIDDTVRTTPIYLSTPYPRSSIQAYTGQCYGTGVTFGVFEVVKMARVHSRE